MQDAGTFGSSDEDPLYTALRIVHVLMAGRGLFLAAEPNIAETLLTSIAAERSTVTGRARRRAPCCGNRSARQEAHYGDGDL